MGVNSRINAIRSTLRSLEQSLAADENSVKEYDLQGPLGEDSPCREELVTQLRTQLAHKETTIKDLTTANTELTVQVQVLSRALQQQEKATLQEQLRTTESNKELSELKTRLGGIEGQSRELRTALNARALIVTDLQAESRSQAQVLALSETQYRECRSLLEGLVQALSAKGPSELLQQVQRLQQKLLQLQSASELVSSMSSFIAQLSPPASFANSLPSHEQIWTWVTNLVSSYMSLKKSLRRRRRVVP